MYRIGADVYCTDNKIGKLIKVVLDPHTQRITDLIVEKGLLVKQDRVIPVEVVREANEDRINLSISSQEMMHFPEYKEEEFYLSEPAVLREMGYSYEPDEALLWATRYGIPIEPYRPVIKDYAHAGIDPNRTPIGRGTRVFNQEGTIGYIDHLLVDKKSGEITHLVVRRGLLPYHYQIVIPIEMVRSIDEDNIYVPSSREQLEQLKRYTPRKDARIFKELTDRLSELKEFDLSQVKVSLADGLVKLTGSVLDRRAKQRAQEIAQDIEGVVGIENQITTSEKDDVKLRKR